MVPAALYIGTTTEIPGRAAGGEAALIGFSRALSACRAGVCQPGAGAARGTLTALPGCRRIPGEWPRETNRCAARRTARDRRLPRAGGRRAGAAGADRRRVLAGGRLPVRRLRRRRHHPEQPLGPGRPERRRAAVGGERVLRALA